MIDSREQEEFFIWEHSHHDPPDDPNRQAYDQFLTALAVRLLPYIPAPLPPFRVASCALPAPTIGHCRRFEDHASILISAKLDNLIAIGETLMHELIHAALLPIGSVDEVLAHDLVFAALALGCGLRGRPTHTYAGPHLRMLIAGMVGRLFVESPRYERAFVAVHTPVWIASAFAGPDGDGWSELWKIIEPQGAQG